MGGEGVILFRTFHTAEAELSSHHNTRTTRTMTIWLKDKFAPQRRIKMQIVVQKIANAVTEKGNLKIFRDVVKDSNSEKIAGRKTIQGGFIWFPSESERRKKNENIYIVGLKMQHLEVCKEPLETCNCCQLWVDLLSVDFIIYPQIIPVSEFYCNSSGAKICNRCPTFYLREFIFFICSWWRASPAKMLAQNDWSTEIMTTRVWRWQKIFSINTTDRDEKCKWKAEVMQLKNSTETKKIRWNIARWNSPGLLPFSSGGWRWAESRRRVSNPRLPRVLLVSLPRVLLVSSRGIELNLWKRKWK